MKNNTEDKIFDLKLKEINKRMEERERKADDPSGVYWQYNLELLLLLGHVEDEDKIGKMVPLKTSGMDEQEMFCDIATKIDLPPDISAALITPSAFKELNKVDPVQSSTVPSAWEKNSYNLLVSHYKDRSVIMQVVLTSAGSIGIDVYEEGDQFAEFTYNSNQECLDDLSEKIWMFFSPKTKLTTSQIIRYTDNWFHKNLYTYQFERVPLHTEYSYVHNPQLLDISPIEAVFKLLTTYVPQELESLEETVDVVNEYFESHDIDEEISIEGIENENINDCLELLSHIIAEFDLAYDTLEFLDHYEAPKRNLTDKTYLDALMQAANQIYYSLVGKNVPQPVLQKYRENGDPNKLLWT